MQKNPETSYISTFILGFESGNLRVFIRFPQNSSVMVRLLLSNHVHRFLNIKIEDITPGVGF